PDGGGDVPPDRRGAVRERRRVLRRARGGASRGGPQPLPRPRPLRAPDRGGRGARRGTALQDRGRRAPRRAPAARGGTRSAAGAIRSGILVDGRVYSRTIPDGLNAAVAGAVGAEIAGGGDRLIAVDGVPHRVFERALHAGSGFPPAYQVGLYSMAEALARRRE